jgi:Ca-activated chloride channel homolog
VSFIWPAGLLLLLLIPCGVAANLALGRRRRSGLARYGTMALDSGSARRGRGVRGFVPPALAIAGMTVLGIGLARPQAIVNLPRLEGTVILAFDVSASMGATDISPTRMAAAKAAAKAFVEQQPSTVQVGVVAFSDSGIAVQPATSDQAAILGAIDRLTPQRGTSLGGGILASLQAIDAAENPNAGYYTNRPQPSQAPVPAGSHTSALIVLLSDGENNVSPDPQVAAQAAADRGVRIYTVGIGSPAGTSVDIDGFKVHTQLDEAALQQIADTTRGTYFAAPDQAHLDAIYSNLDAGLVVKAQPTEITPLFAAAGVLLLLLAAVASLAWLGRAP